MVTLTAPLTKKQLDLLNLREHLERRMSFDTTPPNGYGLGAQVQRIDDELATLEQSKRKETRV